MENFDVAFRPISFLKNASEIVFEIQLMPLAPEDKHAATLTDHAVHCTISYENYIFIESL